MQNGLVTVVLPIYNVEKYLNQCIESVVNQTYRNLEILLIDDGSPDSCPEICNDWAKRDSRIRVIHKENAGLGMARNTGIENANGEYICFFDSDDFVELNVIEKSYQCAKENAAELVIFGLNKIDSKGNVISSFVPTVGNKTYVGDEVVNSFLPDFIAPDPKGDKQFVFYMSSWLLLYSVDAIKKADWRFVSEREIIAEDVYSLIALVKHINRVSVLPEALYNYRFNEISLSRKYIPDRYKKIKYFYNKCVELCTQLDYSDDIMHRITKPYLGFTISALKQEVATDRTFAEKMASIKSIINDADLTNVLKANKNDNVSFTRRLLFFAIRNKLYALCYMLLATKSGA